MSHEVAASVAAGTSSTTLSPALLVAGQCLKLREAGRCFPGQQKLTLGSWVPVGDVTEHSTARA